MISKYLINVTHVRALSFPKCKGTEKYCIFAMFMQNIAQIAQSCAIVQRSHPETRLREVSWDALFHTSICCELLPGKGRCPERAEGSQTSKQCVEDSDPSVASRHLPFPGRSLNQPFNFNQVVPTAILSKKTHRSRNKFALRYVYSCTAVHF